MVVATVVAALVAAGALGTAALLRADRQVEGGDPAPSSAPGTSPSVGADGCLVAPCTVLGVAHVGGTTVELVADHGARSGRLRIGGGGASDVLEVTITDNDATLTDQSLRCVPSTLSVCVVRGPYEGGLLAQVAVGRSQEWDWLTTPIASDAGYLTVAEVTGAYTGAEVVAAQHRCDRTQVADCSGTPVFLEMYSSGTGELIGCSGNYRRLESLPGWPNPDPDDVAIKQCA